MRRLVALWSWLLVQQSAVRVVFDPEFKGRFVNRPAEARFWAAQSIRPWESDTPIFDAMGVAK